MTTFQLFVSSVASLAVLGVAVGLLRAARYGSRPSQFVRRTTFVFPDDREDVVCAAGSHVVKRDRAVRDGMTYDGRQIWLCHKHRFERKRQLYTDGQGAA